MWYSVPETKPTPSEKPKPIFPWEHHAERPKATRVFAEDLQSPPIVSPTREEPPALPSTTNPFATVHYEEEDPEPSMPEVVPSSSERKPTNIADAFQSNSNAWDAEPGIDRYVRAIMDSHSRRANPQVIYSTGDSEEILTGAASRKDRRESLLITDFPSAIERPSLPVTPAPRPAFAFWGQDKKPSIELPSAEGVPDQALWVCPQCGFQSVRLDDFRRTAPEHLSISTITASSTPPVVAPPTAPKPEAPGIRSPPKTSTAKAAELTPSGPQYRSGVSARGAPLASLTDPSLLAPSPSVSGPSIASPPASPAPSLRVATAS